MLFNAVDAQPWADAAPAEALAGRPGPLVGYAGMIQHRVDAPLLVDHHAACCPRCASCSSGASRRRTGVSSATRGRTCGWPGSGPTHELPGLIAACDVCIVPHVRDELTATMDPLKLYEYAAAGKPVVSTVPSPNPALAGQAAVAWERTRSRRPSPRRRATDDATRRAIRRGAVEHETWPRRVDRVLQVLGAALDGRGMPL